jgi:hypothetical protein
MIIPCGSIPKVPSPIPPPAIHDLSSIAGTNATVIGIVFAVLLVFVAFVFERLHEKRSGTFDSAYRINDVGRASFSFGREPRFDWFDPSKPEDRQKVASELTGLLMGAGPQGPAKVRMETAMQLISVLGSHYPFPTTHRHPAGGGTEIGIRQDVEFGNDLSRVRDWVQDVESVTGRVLWLFGTHAAEIKQLADDYDAQDDRFKGLPEGLPAIRIGQGAVSDFIRQIEAAETVRVETSSRLADLDRYRDRQPTLPTILTFVALGLAAFITGVLLPMAWTDTPWGLAVWAPVVFYVAVVAAGLRALLGAYEK